MSDYYNGYPIIDNTISRQGIFNDIVANSIKTGSIEIDTLDTKDQIITKKITLDNDNIDSLTKSNTSPYSNDNDKITSKGYVDEGLANKVNTSIIKSTTTETTTDLYDAGYINTELSKKADLTNNQQDITAKDINLQHLYPNYIVFNKNVENKEYTLKFQSDTVRLVGTNRASPLSDQLIYRGCNDYFCLNVPLCFNNPTNSSSNLKDNPQINNFISSTNTSHTSGDDKVYTSLKTDNLLSSKANSSDLSDYALLNGPNQTIRTGNLNVGPGGNIWNILMHSSSNYGSYIQVNPNGVEKFIIHTVSDKTTIQSKSNPIYINTPKVIFDNSGNNNTSITFDNSTLINSIIPSTDTTTTPEDNQLPTYKKVNELISGLSPDLSTYAKLNDNTQDITANKITTTNLFMDGANVNTIATTSSEDLNNVRLTSTAFVSKYIEDIFTCFNVIKLQYDGNTSSTTPKIFYKFTSQSASSSVPHYYLYLNFTTQQIQIKNTLTYVNTNDVMIIDFGYTNISNDSSLYFFNNSFQTGLYKLTGSGNATFDYFKLRPDLNYNNYSMVYFKLSNNDIQYEYDIRDIDNFFIIDPTTAITRDQMMQNGIYIKISNSIQRSTFDYYSNILCATKHTADTLTLEPGYKYIYIRMSPPTNGTTFNLYLSNNDTYNSSGQFNYCFSSNYTVSNTFTSIGNYMVGHFNNSNMMLNTSTLPS